MTARTRVLIATRYAEACQSLTGIVSQRPEYDVVPRLITNGHTDPLYGLDWTPDVLVLRFDDDNLEELASLTAMDPAARPPLIVVGPAGSTRAMQLAIRSGARDFLPEPVDEEELFAALARIRQESRETGAAGQGRVHVVIGAAGGVGASLLAMNMAHMMTDDGRSTVLLDLDLNYSPLAGMLEATAENGLLEALDSVDDLDELALQGFLARHPSGLALLSNVAPGVVLSRDLSPDRLGALVRLLRQHHRHVFIDLPRFVDGLSASAMEEADHIVIVVQQSLAHIRNASRLLDIVTRELAIPMERVRLLVNRYQKNATVELKDIRRALRMDKLFLIPNRYKLAADSLNAGVPLLEADGGSALTKALREVQRSLGDVQPQRREGLLARALPKFARS